MRTTVELPDDVHALAREIAHQQRKSLSEVVTDLIRSATGIAEEPQISRASSGMPIVHIGRPITAEDVRELEDE